MITGPTFERPTGPASRITITRAEYEKLVAADGEAYGRGYRDGLRAGQSIERGVCAALHDNPYPV